MKFSLIAKQLTTCFDLVSPLSVHCSLEKQKSTTFFFSQNGRRAGQMGRW